MIPQNWKSLGLLGIGLCCLAWGCKPRATGTGASAGLSAASLVGPWVASTVDVDVSANGGGGDHFHFDSKELASKQGRKPVLTIFNGDGGYREEIWSLKDSLVQSKAGLWHFYEDSLFMRPNTEGTARLAYKVALDGRGLKLVARVDWNGDGTRDEMVVALKRP
jgi:hypothetical protein